MAGEAKACGSNGEGQRRTFSRSQRRLGSFGVGSDESGQGRLRTTGFGRGRGRIGVIEDESEIVDRRPLLHEVEIEDRHHPVAIKQDVVVPEISAHQLTGSACS